MTEEKEAPHILYVPHSPNVGAADPSGDLDDSKRATRDRVRADDLAAKVSVGDELSGYEKVAGRGIPRA